MPPPPTHLYKALLEEDLGDLLENGQQSRVVNSYPSLEERKNVLNLWYLLVVLRETVNGVGEHLLDQRFLVSWGERTGEREGVSLLALRNIL